MEKKNQPTEQKAFSQEVKNSLEKAETKTPKHVTKKGDAVGHLHLIEGNRDQLLEIYNHFHSIGADNQVLVTGGEEEKRKRQNRMVLQKWFQTLVIKNRRFPHDMPVAFVLREFFDAILQKKVSIKGFNLLAHMDAFHEWIDNYEHELRSKFWAQQNPDARPKALPDKGSFAEEEIKKTAQEISDEIKSMYGNKVPESLQKYIID